MNVCQQWDIRDKDAFHWRVYLKRDMLGCYVLSFICLHEEKEVFFLWEKEQLFHYAVMERRNIAVRVSSVSFNK